MGYKRRLPGKLPFLYYGRVANDSFLPQTFSCRVWLHEPIEDLTPAERELIPEPLRKFVLVAGPLVCIGSSDKNEIQREKTIQFLVKNAYKGKSNLPAFDPDDIPTEHLELVTQMAADWSDSSTWDRLAADVDLWLTTLHRRAPIALATINWIGLWLGRDPYTAWHRSSLDSALDDAIWNQLASGVYHDTAFAPHARQLASSLVYFLTDNPSNFDGLEADPVRQTVLANLGWGPEAEHAITLLGALVSEEAFAHTASRATTLSTVYSQRGFSDPWMFTTVATPSENVWVIQAGKRAFYLRTPIRLNAVSRADAAKDQLLMPDWGIVEDIDSITTGHIDFARAFNTRYERLVEFGEPSSEDDHRFVAAYDKHVARVIDWCQ